VKALAQIMQFIIYLFVAIKFNLMIVCLTSISPNIIMINKITQRTIESRLFNIFINLLPLVVFYYGVNFAC